MEFMEITENVKVSTGEYLLYEPAQKIVLCGGFSRDRDRVQALLDGRYIEDKIRNFKKIKLNKQEQRTRRISRCKGCGAR